MSSHHHHLRHGVCARHHLFFRFHPSRNSTTPTAKAELGPILRKSLADRNVKSILDDNDEAPSHQPSDLRPRGQEYWSTAQCWCVCPPRLHLPPRFSRSSSLPRLKSENISKRRPARNSSYHLQPRTCPSTVSDSNLLPNPAKSS